MADGAIVFQRRTYVSWRSRTKRRGELVIGVILYIPLRLVSTQEVLFQADCLLQYQRLILHPTMHRSNTYDLFTSPREASIFPHQKPYTGRVKSLHKIKVSHKGLPKDFFNQHKIKSHSHRSSHHEQTRNFNEFEDIRTTPTFPEPLTVDTRQPREYKSEERISKPEREEKVLLSPVIDSSGQLTFSKEFFRERPTPKTIKLHIRRKTERTESDVKGEMMMFSPMKTQIGEIMKRKKLDRQKYPYLLCQRNQPQNQNKLPTLKVRLPSAFGV